MKRLWRGEEKPEPAERREWMVATQLEARGIRDAAVLAAMRRVPRERFLPEDLASRAHDDNAQPIGRGQTISQPYIVALMTEALNLKAWRQLHRTVAPKVLDIGTGSGYQAAVLAELGADVVSIERDAELAHEAERRLRELGYDVRVIVGDGSAGAPEEAPFAGIVVAAAAPAVPAPLVVQLAEGARLVVPVGTRFEQRIVVVRREAGRTVADELEPAVFVPLLGEHGFSER